MPPKNGPKKSKGKKAAKPQAKTPAKEETFDLHPETRAGLLTLLILVLAILFTLAYFGIAGVVGEYMAAFDRDLLGLLSPLLPLFLYFVVFARVTGRKLGIDTAVKIGVTSFLLALATLIHLLVSYPNGVTFGKMLVEGGGYLGMVFAYLLFAGLGFWGALVVASAAILGSLILIFKTSLVAILTPHRAIVGLFSKKDASMSEEDEEVEEEEPEEEEEEKEAESDKKSLLGGIFTKKTVKGTVGSEAETKTKAVVEEAAKPKKIFRKVNLPIDLLNGKVTKPTSGDVVVHQRVIQHTLENFGIPCEMGEYSVGPTVTQYTLKPADGVKLSRLTALSNDLALALAAHPIRIEAPIPGKSLVGIEVPNEAVAVVNLREVIDSDAYRSMNSPLRAALGKDVTGKPWVANLAKMPHMLVAGSTGSGKTVCLNAIIVSLLYSNSPAELRLLLVDPKRVELPIYNAIPHMLVPAVTETAKTVNALRWAIGEMDRRFNLLSKFGKRDIGSYNETVEEKMPYIVIVVDELADLMVSSAAKEVEGCIIRLAQMSRAVGIHLILATQRPSVDVITGLIKANITARIAFAVASATDSRTILDQQGAEKLVGRGDMLFVSSDMSTPKRLQGAFVSDTEIRKVVDFIVENYEAPEYESGVTEHSNGPGSPTVLGPNGESMPDGDGDPLLGEAQDIIVRAGKASASFLQRRLKIGYARAARILDLLEEKGIIGPGEGAKPRNILVARPPDAAPITDEPEITDGEDEEDEADKMPPWE
jgi:S-DNA-T family DNA segregation ATPase FtsK/SpoIIIE